MLLDAKRTREVINEAVMETTNAITSTLGPNGSVVICDFSGIPSPTKDGVSVAKAMRHELPEKDLIARMISEGCKRTDDMCGDGTTTTALLLKNFYFEFKDIINFKTKFKLNQLVTKTVNRLNELKVDVDIDSDILRNVMLTTSNNDQEMVESVLQIYRDNPHLPKLALKEGSTDLDEVQNNGACSWPAQYANPVLSPGGTGQSVKLNNYRVAVTSGEINLDGSNEDLTELLRTLLTSNDVRLVLVGRGITKDSEYFISKFNELQARNGKELAIIPVSVSAAGSSGVGLMGDIAGSLGVTLRPDLNQSFVEYDPSVPYDIGADIVISNNRLTLFRTTELHDERVNNTLAKVKETLDGLTAEQRNSAIGNIIRHRFSILNGGDVVVFIGGLSSSDIKERLARFQDVGRVCQSALVNGVLEGCGYSLAKISDELIAEDPEDEITRRFAKVLRSQTILLMGEWKEGMTFINLATGEEGKTPKEINVWDAALATITALEASMKIAILLMDTSNIIMKAKGNGVQMY